MRGRELAAAAAGLPPLDSDQVLDLQRTAGNRLTTGALARWTDGLGAAIQSEADAALARFATPEQALAAPPAELLDHLLPALAADPAATRRSAPRSTRSPRAWRCASRAPRRRRPRRCASELRGPAGGEPRRAPPSSRPGLVATIELPFAARSARRRGSGRRARSSCA